MGCHMFPGMPIIEVAVYLRETSAGEIGELTDHHPVLDGQDCGGPWQSKVYIAAKASPGQPPCTQFSGHH